MVEPATIDAVMRTLADPTRRAVFERIVTADEINVAELNAGQRGHAGRDIPASQTAA